MGGTTAPLTVSLTNPARTVVDCFRYRNKLGLDIALEALRDVLRSGQASADDLKTILDVHVKKYIDETTIYDRKTRDEQMRKYEALSDNVTSDDLLKKILNRIPLPEVTLHEPANFRERA